MNIEDNYLRLFIKNRFLYTFFLFSVLASFSLQCAEPLNIDRELSKTCDIETIKERQEKIAAHFKHYYIPTHPKSLHAIIALFAQGEAYPLIKDNQQDLKEAITLFSETEGFSSLITNIMRCIRDKSAKGYVYELLRALSIHKKYGTEDPILSLGKKITIKTKNGSYLTREFDIITDKYAIECKCRDIQKGPDEHPNITKKLLEQKQVIDSWNQGSKSNITFQLSSYHPLSSEWHSWLNFHNIELYEGT